MQGEWVVAQAWRREHRSVTRPLVHSFSREQVDPLPIGIALILEFLTNDAGELQFTDAVAGGPHSLSDLLGGMAQPSEPRVSGVTTFGAGLLSVFSDTTVRIEAGTNEVLVEKLTGGATLEHLVSWPQTDIVVSGIADAEAFFEVQDLGFSGAGTVVETAAPPADSAERSGIISLGSSVHADSVVVAVINQPRTVNEQGNLLRVLLRTIGTIRRTGSISEIAASLTHTHDAIEIVGDSINWQLSPLFNPHELTVPPSASPAVFRFVEPDGDEIDPVATIFAKQWFDTGGGGLTNLTGKRAVVHQIVITPAGLFVQCGTTNYKDYQEAVAAIGLERLTNPLEPTLARYGSVMGYAVLANDATVWADGRAHLFEESPLGSSFAGGGVSAFDGLADTPISKAGEDGKVVFVGAAETDLEYGKIRAQLIISPIADNVDSITLDVARALHVNSAELRIENIHLEVLTAPTADLEVDVRIAGSSIFGGTLPTISGAALTGQLAPVTTDHFMGDRVRIDIASADADWRFLTVTIEASIVPE